jgi:putative zinc finger protein
MAMTGYETATTRLVHQELGACALIQDLLPLYMEHEVSASSRDLIAEHLARCERCAGYMAGARSMREQLQREGTLRASQATQDHATQQAIALGQRRLRWLVVGGLCTLFGFGLMVTLALGILRSASDRAIAPGFAATPVISGVYPPEFMPDAPIDPAVEAAPIDRMMPSMDPAMSHEMPPTPPDAPQSWPTATPVPGP